MRSRLFIILLFLTFAAGLSAQEADYRLNVQDFTELTVVDGIRVDYYARPDSAGWAVFSCVPELASEIMFTNDVAHLTIRTTAEEAPLVGMPRVKVYSSVLHKVENSGDSIVRVYATVPVKDFKARQIGNGELEIHSLDAENFDGGVTTGCGKIMLDGKAKKAKINNVGSGPVDASRFLVTNLSCFVFGTGDIECSPVETLRVYGAGSGKVLYHGKPGKITKRGIGVKAIAKDEEHAMKSAKLLSKR